MRRLGKIAGCAHARILRNEGIRRQKNGGSCVADTMHDVVGLARRRMQHGLDPEIQRHERANRQPEGMEGGQRIEDDIAMRQIGNMHAHLFDIGENVGVRKRDTLRFALGAGGEKG